MAVEKTKVINRFKTLFGTIGLSNTRLDEISAKLAGKLADEATDEQIDERINDLNEVYPFSEIKKNDDRTLNEKNNPNKKQDQPAPKEEVKDEDPIKQLLSEFKSFKTELETLKADRTSQTISERFRKDERVSGLKGLQEHMFKGRIPKTEEEYESAVTDFVNDWKPFLEKNKLEDQGGDAPAGGHGKKSGDIKKLSPEEAKQIVSQMNS